MKITDTDRLNWLEETQMSLISDDAGNWACTVDGIQNIPDEFPGDIDTTFFIEQKKWCPSIREAIDQAVKDNK